MLEPVRASYKTGEPIRWTKVHDLPDFAHFNHSIHVAKGVGCAECHGRVARLKAEPHDYGLLAELNTQPRTSYLAKIKNPNPEIEES